MNSETILGVKAYVFPLLFGSSKCRVWQLLQIVTVELPSCLWPCLGENSPMEESRKGQSEWVLRGGPEAAEENRFVS